MLKSVQKEISRENLQHQEESRFRMPKTLLKMLKMKLREQQLKLKPSEQGLKMQDKDLLLKLQLKKPCLKLKILQLKRQHLKLFKKQEKKLFKMQRTLNLQELTPKRKLQLKSQKREEKKQHFQHKEQLMLLINSEETRQRELLLQQEQTKLQKKPPLMKREKQWLPKLKHKMKPKMQRLLWQSELLRERQENSKNKFLLPKLKDNNSRMLTLNSED